MYQHEVSTWGKVEQKVKVDYFTISTIEMYRSTRDSFRTPRQSLHTRQPKSTSTWSFAHRVQSYWRWESQACRCSRFVIVQVVGEILPHGNQHQNSDLLQSRTLCTGDNTEQRTIKDFKPQIIFGSLWV